MCVAVCERGRGFRFAPLLKYITFFHKVGSRVHLIKRDSQTQIRGQSYESQTMLEVTNPVGMYGHWTPIYRQLTISSLLWKFETQKLQGVLCLSFAFGLHGTQSFG